MTEKKPKSRADYLADIADNVQALTIGMHTSTSSQRAAGDGEDGIRRRSPEHFTWRLAHPGLLLQLRAALVPGGGITTDSAGGGRGKPSSKPPLVTAAAAALDDITNGWQTGPSQEDRQVGVIALQVNMRREARRTGAPRRPLERAVEDVRHLAHLLPDPWPADVAAAARAWVQRARTAMGLDAPVATLRDVACPHCGARLKVRSDASSDVWCPTPACRDIDGNRHRWAKSEWPFLLERIAGRQDGAA